MLRRKMLRLWWLFLLVLGLMLCSLVVTNCGATPDAGGQPADPSVTDGSGDSDYGPGQGEVAVGPDSLAFVLPGSFEALAASRSTGESVLIATGSITGDKAPEVASNKTTRVPLVLTLTGLRNATPRLWKVTLQRQADGGALAEEAQIVNGQAYIAFEALTPGRYDVHAELWGTSDGEGNGAILIEPQFGSTPVMCVHPTPLLDFGSQETVRTFGISNTGGGQLAWRVTANTPWITAVSPSEGTGNGTVSLTVDRSGMTPGAYTGGLVAVSSNAGDIKITVCVEVPEEGDSTTSVALAVSPSSVTVGGGATATATVLRDGLGAAGETVTFALSASGVAALSSKTASTNADGVASVSLTGLAVGQVSVTASVSGASSGSQSLTVTREAEPAVSLSLSPHTVSVGGTATATATVTDGGVPQSGQVVKFTVTDDSVASLSSDRGVTDSAGRASVTLTGKNTGQCAITASALGVTSESQQLAVSTTGGGGVLELTLGVAQPFSLGARSSKQWFRIAAVSGQHLMFFSHLSDRWYVAMNYSMQGRPSDGGFWSSNDLDQVREFTADRTGWCYICVDRRDDAGSGQGELVVFDDNTFPATAQPGSEQSVALDARSCKEWYRIWLSVGQRLSVYLHDDDQWDVALALSMTGLPFDGGFWSSRDRDQVQELVADRTGWCYMCVDRRDDAGSGLLTLVPYVE